MTSPNGQRGAKAERDLVVWLRDNGWPDACRARGEGTVDRGDIGGVPDTCIQVKNALRAEYLMARLQAAQSGAVAQAHGRRPVAVVRLPGITDPAEWWATCPVMWRRGSPGIPGSYDLPIDAAHVGARSTAHAIHRAIWSNGGALRGEWWVTTVERLFATLRAAT